MTSISLDASISEVKIRLLCNGFFLILFIPSTSYAYLDPGAGSFFTQFIVSEIIIKL